MRCSVENSKLAQAMDKQYLINQEMKMRAEERFMSVMAYEQRQFKKLMAIYFVVISAVCMAVLFGYCNG